MAGLCTSLGIKLAGCRRRKPELSAAEEEEACEEDMAGVGGWRWMNKEDGE